MGLTNMQIFLMPSFLLHRFTGHLQSWEIRIRLQHVHDFFLYDDGSQETEAQNDIPGNWWLNVIAIQSEVAQTRNAVIDGVVNGFDSNRTDTGATHTCKYTKGIMIYKGKTGYVSDKQSYSIDAKTRDSSASTARMNHHN